MQRILASLLIFVLAACGGAQTATTPSATPAPPTASAPTPTAESGGESELISAEPLAVDVSALDAGTFAATISGKFNLTMNGPAVFTSIPNGYALSMSNATPDGNVLVFMLPAGITPGSYAITTSFSDAQANGGLAANYTNLAGETSETYGTVTSGRITLESVSPFTGAFEVVFDTNGEAITVTGAFNQALMMSSGA